MYTPRIDEQLFDLLFIADRTPRYISYVHSVNCIQPQKNVTGNYRVLSIVNARNDTIGRNIDLSSIEIPGFTTVGILNENMFTNVLALSNEPLTATPLSSSELEKPVLSFQEGKCTTAAVRVTHLAIIANLQQHDISDWDNTEFWDIGAEQQGRDDQFMIKVAPLKIDKFRDIKVFDNLIVTQQAI